MATTSEAVYSDTWAMIADPSTAVGSIVLRKLFLSHDLIEICCATGDLVVRPVMDRSAQACQIHLVKEVAEREIRWRPTQLQA
jgi:hypothetical protein